jgi:hypothetical protein
LTIAAPGTGLSSVSHDSTLIGDGTGGFPLGLANSSVGTTQLGDGAVTQTKIGPGAVGTAALVDASVTSAKIAAGAVTSGQIASGAVTASKIAPAPVDRRRAALNQWWTAQPNGFAQLTTGISPNLLQSDGADLWVANGTSGTVQRFRASDGSLLGTWTGANGGFGVLCALGRVFITGGGSSGVVYTIDPTQPPGAVTTLTSVGADPQGIAFDGQRIWTANQSGSVSYGFPSGGGSTSVTFGFSHPMGALFDGSNVWVTDGNSPLKLDSGGGTLQTVTVGTGASYPVFDGVNIWVPNRSANSVTVVQASSGTVVATLNGNGLNGPTNAAFDGQRVVVTNQFNSSVSIWRAGDLTPIGAFFNSASNTFGACSDGVNFWVTLQNGPSAGSLQRF